MSILRYFQSIPEAQAEDDTVPPSTLDSGVHQDLDHESDSDCASPPKKSCFYSVRECHDLARYADSTIHLSDADKYQLLSNPFHPGADYKFPKSATGRTFQRRWLQLHPWLAYSEETNGGFCTPCVLFATSGYHGSDLGILVRRPLVSFSKALEVLSKHTTKDYHRAAIVRADMFLQVMRNEQPDIRSQMNQVVADRIASNRKKLASIIKTIVLCGHQNIALRGHRDNATDLEEDNLHNHGNFWALLKFRVDSGDTVLQEHLTTSPRNATYTSPKVQNQLINIISNQIQQKILEKVKTAQWFTVIADEVTDFSNKELMSLVLRYVDCDTGQAREDLMEFLECDTGITGRSLADKIMATLQSYGLDLTHLRGQAYDGAGNMAGSIKGTAALIMKKYPLAMYLHCASHCLNLAVVKSLQITSVRNMMGVIDRVHVFFDAHPKRQRALEKAIAETQPESRITKVKDLCRTRWIQRIDALLIFQSLHISIVGCMEEICSEGPKLWSSDSLTDATSLQLAITTTDFISSLVITNACLKYIQALTTNLQAEAKDIVEAVKDIGSVKAALNNVRSNIDEHHNSWFQKVQQMCSEVDVEPSLPRRCGRQIHRSNMPADTPSSFYCRSVSIPLLDHLLSEIESRFTTHQQTALLGLSLVPSVMVNISLEECSTEILALAKKYQEDLPSHDSIEGELPCWWMKWQQELNEHGQASLPTTPTQALRHASSMFPNIQVLLRILCTLPVTSCSAERSFSAVKRSKTALRSSMGTDRLTGLTLLHVHRLSDIPVDVGEVINEFSRRHPRRLQMSNILAD